jgi:spoIIIJ-associated protein
MTDNESSALTQGSREFVGKTVEYAIEAACKYFKAGPDDLEINILTRGFTGIFGLGGRKAKIQAVLKKSRPQVTEEKSEEESGQAEAVADHGILEPPEPEGNMIESGGMEAPEDQDKYISLAREIAEDLLNKAGLAGQVVIKIGEEGPYLDISGEDLSLIIGKEGQNLNALEYIVNRILRHRVKSHAGIRLEAQSYREKREKSISLLAHRTAKKAQKTGRPFTLQPLGAIERRLVHLTLKDVKGIRTHSIGEGIMRKVVISPVRRTARQRQRNKKNNST